MLLYRLYCLYGFAEYLESGFLDAVKDDIKSC